LIFLSLLSHYTRDMSFNTKASPAVEPQNVIGRFGAHTSDVLIQFGGFASALLPLVLAGVGLLLYRRHALRPALGQLAGFVIFLLTVATILALFFDEIGGGAIGLALADLLEYGLGLVGGIIVALAMFVISLILAVDFSFVGVANRLRSLTANLRHGIGERRAKRRVTRERQAKHAEQARVAQTRGGPVIRDGMADLEKPAARESKSARMHHGDKPVKSTRIDQPPAEAPPKPSPKPSPKPKPATTPRFDKGTEDITIHRQAETVTAQQISFSKLAGEYEPPPLSLLQSPPDNDDNLDREALIAQSVAVESKLATFGVTGKVVEIHPGPVITMFEYEPDAGIKLSKIANLEDDLAMALQAEKIRIIAPIPGKGAVGIEVPSLRREIVYLREILESKEFNDANAPLAVAFGKDSTGRPMVQNLARMPHLLVAGTTGAGKSVFLNAVIMSLMYKSTPDTVRLLMVDPKQLELSMYTDTPHMLHPVIIEPKKAALLLRWAVGEMEERYGKLAEQRVRNIDSYNAKVAKLQNKPRKGKLTGEDEEPIPEKLPYIVVIIDELADLMMIAAKEVEESIARLAQMARAAGIHLILATQRPSVDVITGIIKANFPSRIAFQVRSRIDSRTILDENGANNLLGLGDGLFLPPGASKIERFHAAFVADEEVHGIVQHLKEHHAPPPYVEIRTAAGTDLQDADASDLSLSSDSDGDDNVLFDKAVEIVARDRKASVSYIQRKLKIGYNRAARIVERMEHEGMIAPSDGTSRGRDIYLPEVNYD
jgi:DNA segregation ATPase FtsK/SpoIIIE, S-DNA-T family